MHDEFAVHRLNDDGLTAAEELACVFDAALTDIERIAGAQGRYISIVRTKLEEACFFAKKAVATNPVNQA